MFYRMLAGALQDMRQALGLEEGTMFSVREEGGKEGRRGGGRGEGGGRGGGEGGREGRKGGGRGEGRKSRENIGSYVQHNVLHYTITSQNSTLFLSPCKRNEYH